MMYLGRILLAVTGALLLNFLLVLPAFAVFGFGGEESPGKSGLDMIGGYDVNTVTTITGKAVSTPHRLEKDQVIIEVQDGSQTVTLCAGPFSYWEPHGIPVAVKDELIAKGSMAQGRDGKKYLMLQKLQNKTTGGSVELRNENGVPAWSGRGTNRSGRTEGGMRNRGGMMRGGGGMMRR